MTRSIKFRAWDKVGSKMVTVLSMDVGFPSTHNNIYTKEGGYFHEDDYELVQFTGLFDKNGKEIYEGDILHYKANQYDFNGEVVFEDGGFALKRSGMTYELCQAAIRSCEVMEVMGNIYENNELLQ